MPPCKPIAVTLLLAMLAVLSCIAQTATGAPRAAESAGVAPSTPGPPHVRAYVFRGVLGLIFSRGMDKLNERLEQAGIQTEVHGFEVCESIANRAIKDYRNDPAPIALIGHSAGAVCTLRFATILNENRIPVSLIVAIDSPKLIVAFDVPKPPPRVPLNVERFINIYMSDSVLGGADLPMAQGYGGHYASFDLASQAGINHVNIDKIDVVHDQLVAKIRELAVTPALTQSEHASLRYVVPPDAPIDLWDSGTPVVAHEGDTLQSFAMSYGVPLWSLVQINQLSDSEPLAAGRRIIVPRHLMPPVVNVRR